MKRSKLKASALMAAAVAIAFAVRPWTCDWPIRFEFQVIAIGAVLLLASAWHAKGE